MSARRRLLAWFAAATILPLSGMAWLAWQIVDQDRDARAKIVVERRERSLSVATAALQRSLAEAEERLTAAATAPLSSLSQTRTFAAESGAAMAMFDRRGGLIFRAGTFLPYYPGGMQADVPSPVLFAPSEKQEFITNDPRAAIAVLQPLARSANVAVRAEALLRLARNYRKAGDTARALATFAELELLEAVPASGVAAGLAARQGHALLFEALGRRDDVRRDAASLGADLDRGRWPLTRTQYEFARAQAHAWSGPEDSVPVNRLDLAEAMESGWRDWRNGSSTNLGTQQRRLVRSPHGSTVIFWRTMPDRFVLLAVGRVFIQAGWLTELATAGPDVSFALTDGEGQPVIGRSDAPLTMQSIRTASSTMLPWTIHAITARPSVPGLSRASRLSLGAIALTALMLVATAYAISRAVARELSAAELQSDFVAAVSHEFRTPLTTIRQLSEMLTRGRVSTNERRQQFYETLLRESERLQRLVEGLLAFGRMEAGVCGYTFTSIDPESLAREVVADFQQDVTASAFVVDIRVNGPLPRIRADASSLSRVFWNLLENAAKYSPDHGTVRVELECADHYVLVHVRDRGIGIPVEEQTGIFRKFVRGAAAKMASIQGTGLGLAMASQIVEAHGGHITVNSVVGAGSTFTVRLPVEESA